MTRTDIHRPSQIIPADYEYLASFAQNTAEQRGFGMERVIELREATVAAGRDVFGAPGRCGTCGAFFIEGDVWRHVPTGALIFFGHRCADEIGSLQGASERQLERRRIARARKAYLTQERNAVARAAFLDAHPGLEEALQTDHYISRDLSAKLTRYGSLSEKQVALAHRLVAQAAERAEREAAEAAKPKAPVPTGRIELTGVVLATKWQDSIYGSSLKMLVEVATPEGSFKVWGTVPRSLEDEELKGAEIAFTGTLEPSQDDPHFGFYKRPARARVVSPAPTPEAQPAA